MKVLRIVTASAAVFIAVSLSPVLAACNEASALSKTQSILKQALDACTKAIRSSGGDQLVRALEVRARAALNLGQLLADSIDDRYLLGGAVTLDERKQRITYMEMALQDAITAGRNRRLDATSHYLRGDIYRALYQARGAEEFSRPLSGKTEKTVLPVTPLLSDDDLRIRAVDHYSAGLESRAPDDPEQRRLRLQMQDARAGMLRHSIGFSSFSSNLVRNLHAKGVSAPLNDTLESDLMAIYTASKDTSDPQLKRLGADAEKNLKRLGVAALMNDTELCESRRDRNVNERIAACTRLAESTANPADWIKAMLKRGEAYHYVKRDLGAAVADYTLVVTRHPDHGRAFELRGHAYFDNEPEKAVADYTEAIRLAPKDDYYVVYRRADAFMKLNRKEEAVKDYRNALARIGNNDSFSASNTRARIRIKLEELGVQP